MTLLVCIALNVVAGAMQCTIAQRRRRAGQACGVNVALSVASAVMVLSLIVQASRA